MLQANQTKLCHLPLYRGRQCRRLGCSSLLRQLEDRVQGLLPKLPVVLIRALLVESYSRSDCTCNCSNVDCETSTFSAGASIGYDLPLIAAKALVLFVADAAGMPPVQSRLWSAILFPLIIATWCCTDFISEGTLYLATATGP